MIRIKVTTMFPYSPLVRQTPGARGRWGDCQFMVDHDDPECDFWVIYGPMRDELTAHCPEGNTILFDDEPPDVRVYDSKFLAQFGSVLSCQPDIDHPNVIRGRQALPWHVGVNRMNETTLLDYDALAAMTHIEKPRLLSLVCSTKATTPGQRLRLRFVDRLVEHFGSDMDLFGRGFLPVGDKWEAVAPYKYHIALENSCVPNYISEKLTDSYLAGAYPFYHGCPNVSDYFAAQAVTPIDVRDPERAIGTIEQTISAGVYESQLTDIWSARRFVLERYNFFAMLAEFCSEMSIGRRQRITITPQWMFNTPQGVLKRAGRRVSRIATRWRRAA